MLDFCLICVLVCVCVRGLPTKCSPLYFLSKYLLVDSIDNSVWNKGNYLCTCWCSFTHKKWWSFRILRRSSLNWCLVRLLRFFHAKWLSCGGVERQRYVCVCWLFCSLWLIIVRNYKDTYTVIICIPMFWNN